MPASGDVAKTERIDVLGVQVSAVDMGDVLACVEQWVDARSRQYVCVTGVHGVMESQGDPGLSSIHNRSGLTVPDGMPMVWSGKFAGADRVERIYGPDMMLEVCELGVRHGWKSFLYGGAPGTAELLESRLRTLVPGIQIVGTYTPPFRALEPEEESEVARLIDDSGADLVWVGLSTPKQERWMSEFVGKLGRPAVLFGVGAAFDIHAGLQKDAPRWVGKLGMHWLYRLVREPRRLWRRYLSNNPKFIAAILRRRPSLVPDPESGLASRSERTPSAESL